MEYREAEAVIKLDPKQVTLKTVAHPMDLAARVYAIVPEEHDGLQLRLTGLIDTDEMDQKPNKEDELWILRGEFIVTSWKLEIVG